MQRRGGGEPHPLIDYSINNAYLRIIASCRPIQRQSPSLGFLSDSTDVLLTLSTQCHIGHRRHSGNHLKAQMSLKLPLEQEYEEEVTERRSSPSGDVESTTPLPPASKWSARLYALVEPIGRLHRNTPFLRRLPAYVLLPITILIIVNCAVWAIVGIILRYHPYPSNQQI